MGDTGPEYTIESFNLIKLLISLDVTNSPGNINWFILDMQYALDNALYAGDKYLASLDDRMK